MICADLQGLVSSHDQSSLSIIFMLQQPDITSSTLLPFSALAVELEELGAHLEGLFLLLLIGLGVDFLGEMDDGLEVDVWLLFVVIL